MRRLILIPTDTKFDFIGKRLYSLGLSVALTLLTVVMLSIQGLNFGVDFAGGLMIEVAMPEAPNLADMRSRLSNLDIGAVQLQEFGDPKDILIRVQTKEQTEAEQARVVGAVKGALGEKVDFRRTEFVGPKVGAELIRAGTLAVILALIGITIYVWFRFEWQFGVGALVSTIHDVVTTIGVFSLFQLEFNLTTVAAILTIAGYSINDTVVVFDRIRENRRKYKRMDLGDLINLSTNQMLTRTVLTSVSTAISIIPLLIFGGPSLFDFTAAILFGIVVGTFSSIYVASALLLYLPAPAGTKGGTGGEAKEAAA